MQLFLNGKCGIAQLFAFLLFLAKLGSAAIFAKEDSHIPRPISWLSRLHEISRSVGNSVRSHYSRRDVETLFELQPRAAQKLLEMLPTVTIGTSHLVDREVLAAFLVRVREADDTTILFETIRQERAAPIRRKTRSLIRRDTEPASLASLPDSISLVRGRLDINFQSIEQLAEAMYALARVLEDEGEEFAQRYEPEATPAEPADLSEGKALFAELERMEEQAMDKSA